MSFAFLPLYTGDYRRDTQHLSMMEHGAYLLLLMHCWDQKGPIPLDERRIFGICNARSNEEMGAVRHVLADFFVKMEDGWYNRRMQKEVERAENVSERRSEAGKKGYEAKAKSLERKGIQANARQLLSKSQASAKQVPLPPPPHSPPPPYSKKIKHSLGFAEFWSCYPHYANRSSKAKCWERWRKMNLDPIVSDVMTALRACLAVPSWTKNGREFVSAAEVWLSKRLWEQDLVSLDDRLIESIASDPRFADMPR